MKKGSVSFLTLLLVAIIVAGGYYFLIYEPNHKTGVSMIPATVTPTTQLVTVTPTVTGGIIKTPSQDETSTIIAAVKKGLIAEHGNDANSLTITVSSINGDYAKGMASAQAGGAIWFAAKVNGVWTLVWDGNGQISCKALAPYPNFPKTMIAECYDDATQKMVTR